MATGEEQPATTGGRKNAEGSGGVGPEIPQRRTISPYDLHANDNPGLIITQVTLKGENYEEWARALRTALRARKKFGFVDGSIPMPSEESGDLEDWWTNNSLLVSWIRNIIEPSLRTTISHLEMASELWEDIKAQFSVLEKKRDEEKVHQFLMGLDEMLFGHLRSTLLSQESFPTTARAYRVLTQEETARASNARERPENTAFAVRNSLDRSGRDKNITCSHYKKVGHDKDACFQLHGFPEGWGERGRQGSGHRGRGRGSNGGRGHSGTGRGATTPSHIAAHTVAAVLPSVSTGQEVSSGVPIPNLTMEQWDTFRALLASVKDNSSEKLSGPYHDAGDWCG